VAQQFGKKPNFGGASGHGDRTAGQADFKHGTWLRVRETGKKKCRGSMGGAGGTSETLRPRRAIHAANVGYLMPHCLANVGALRLLASKAARTSRL
jgi:hypothetical protein